jgi:hypothetical protein
MNLTQFPIFLESEANLARTPQADIAGMCDLKSVSNDMT